MKEVQVIATSHIDLHNERIAREALEKAAEDINNGSRPLLTIEHDLTLPPRGKMIRAWVEKRTDDEYQLVALLEYFDKPENITLQDGTQLVKEESDSDQKPFPNRYSLLPDGYTISYDHTNFQSPAAIKRFIREIETDSGTQLHVREFGRKSYIPDPEIILKIAESVAGILITKKLLDKAGDKLIDLATDEIAKFYNLVKATVVTTAKYARPKNRPRTYVFVIPGNPIIEFVACSTDTDLVLSSVLLDKLQAHVSNALEMHEMFNADKIQYLLDPSGSWKFNYLLTKTGTVIGTPAAHVRRAQRLELLQTQRTNPPKRRRRKKSSNNRR